MQKTLFSAFIFLILYASALPTYALSIATWNLEWLSSHQVTNNTLKIPKRSSADFQQLHNLFIHENIDVLAFQEVNDVGAIRTVVGKNYRIYLSDRSEKKWHKLQFNNINQYTGFAVRKDLFVDDPTDIQLSPKSKLRFASYVRLKRKQQPDLHLLSVHLKSGCFGKWNATKKACLTLKQQGQELKKWIKTRVKNKDSFIILGDFNHNLSYPKDWFWADLTYRQKKHLTLATSKTKSECKMPGRNGKLFSYRYIIDHMITSKDISVLNTHQTIYPAEQLKQYTLSDHCLLQGQLNIINYN